MSFLKKPYLKIAIQGLEGAYGHEAALNNFVKPQIIFCPSSEEVFEKIENQSVDLALVPIENSIVGNVSVNTDLFIKYKIKIAAEFFHPVSHCLLGLPNSEIADIKKVYSHPVALGQCRDFLLKNAMEIIDSFDTAGSAKLINEWQDISKASIASSLASEYYKLRILARDIQSFSKNYTRFCVILPQRHHYYPSEKGPYKTSLAFAAAHSPGALLDTLNIFAKYKINLTKIESRPVPQNLFQYVFYIDFLGSSKDPEISEALGELKEKVQNLFFFGSYPIGKIV